MKQMGERSAGNPHAAFDVEGTGDVARHRPKPARQSSTLPVRDGDGNAPIYSAFGLSQCSKVGFEGRWLGQSGLVGEELQGWPRAMTGMGQNQATREE